MGNQAQIAFDQHISGLLIAFSPAGNVIGLLLRCQRFGERADVPRQVQRQKKTAAVAAVLKYKIIRGAA